jgi:hypothetical protein
MVISPNSTVMEPSLLTWLAFAVQIIQRCSASVGRSVAPVIALNANPARLEPLIKSSASENDMRLPSPVVPNILDMSSLPTLIPRPTNLAYVSLHVQSRA